MKTFQQFMEQIPHMPPNEYNKQVARRQASQKIAQMRHVHQEIGAEARSQERAKNSRLKSLTTQ